MFNFYSKRKASGRVDAIITLTILFVAIVVFVFRFIDITKKSQITNLLKKNYNVMNNVIALSEIDNGYNLYWKLPDSNDFNDIEIFLYKYYIPFLNEAVLVNSKSYDSMYSIFRDSTTNKTSNMITNYIILKDNSILSFYYDVKNKYMLMFVDINGISKPNKMGYDVFVYCIFNGKYHMVSFLEDNNNIGDMKYLMSDQVFGCNKENTGNFRNFYCGRVIELNNWELPKNYPL